MMKKRAYLYAVVAVAVAAAAVIIVSYQQFAQGNQAQVIAPASYSGTACPQLYSAFYTEVSPTGVAGNIKVYNLSNNFMDYLIAPGDTGIIKYNISRVLLHGTNLSILREFNKSIDYSLIANIVNVSNNVVLSHESYITVRENVTPKNITITEYQNGTPHTATIKAYEACYRLPKSNIIMSAGQESCYSSSQQPPEFLNYSYTNNTHAGISITYQPRYTPVQVNNSTTVEVIISVSPNVTHGTYLLYAQMTGEWCWSGPFAYLTIGDSPYSGKVPSIPQT